MASVKKAEEGERAKDVEVDKKEAMASIEEAEEGEKAKDVEVVEEVGRGAEVVRLGGVRDGTAGMEDRCKQERVNTDGIGAIASPHPHRREDSLEKDITKPDKKHGLASGAGAGRARAGIIDGTAR